MDNNTRRAILGGAGLLTLGLACLATHSAEPLWFLVLVALLFL